MDQHIVVNDFRHFQFIERFVVNYYDFFLEFTIRSVDLLIEPHVNVTRGTNVTVRCKALISSLEDQLLSREYIIFKDNNNVYTKTSITSEDFLYPLPDARVSNTGKYRCAINIEGKLVKSDDKKLTVTGWFDKFS